VFEILFHQNTNMGKRIMGNKLVTPMGNASVTHHNAITTAIAAVMVTPGLPGTKSRKNTIPRKMSIPKTKNSYLTRFLKYNLP
jgi:hypothetical protein